MARTVRKYSAEFRQEAVALVTDERSIMQVARELDIPDQTLWKWVDAKRKEREAADDAAVGPVDPAAYKAALRRIAELERENEFLGKVSAFFASKPRT